VNNDKLIEAIEMECPICNAVHSVEKRQRDTKSLVKGEEVDFNEVYFLCNECDEEENEFVPAGIMDQNLLKARDAYRRKKSLLTSEEIAEIRKIYGLTQSEYSALLGWGDVTITRYESKTIQDETYDNIMRLSMENPTFALDCLEKHRDRFSKIRFNSIRKVITERIEKIGSLYLKRQQIKSQYVTFSEPSVFNGYKTLDINKLANVIGYFAQFVNNLYKVKLMKLLWYTDALFYARHGSSMTGLVYKHMPLGALPIAHDEIVTLPTVEVVEELINTDIAYKIVPRQEICLSAFTLNELSVLELVAKTFKDCKTKEIVDYIHEEKAYIETAHQQIISYDLAKQLKSLK
jgi:putative zinc finger/helix-turn-helix YgiT family protein